MKTIRKKITTKSEIVIDERTALDIYLKRFNDFRLLDNINCNRYQTNYGVFLNFNDASRIAIKKNLVILSDLVKWSDTEKVFISIDYNANSQYKLHIEENKIIPLQVSEEYYQECKAFIYCQKQQDIEYGWKPGDEDIYNIENWIF